MIAWLKSLAAMSLLTIGACVSAGTCTIKDAGVVAQIEVGKSSKGDVVALLGYPLTASYGVQGEETWYYTCITAYPKATEFVPLVKALPPPLQEATRHVYVTFNRGGTVTARGNAAPPQAPQPAPEAAGHG
jgi:outer membrane protein assembly factor BamE (lipoprotein component of BamABCDE complex)